MKVITLTQEELGQILSSFLCDIDYDHWKELNFDYEGCQAEDDPEWYEGKFFVNAAERFLPSEEE